jgi:acyl dehydratase
MVTLNLNVGADLPPVEMPPVTRAQLALFAGGSHDHTSVHIDSDSAREFGFPDVFAQGMFVMAILGRSILQTIPQEKLKTFSVRFVDRTQIGDRLTCRGRVVERSDNGDARFEITFTNQTGGTKLRGEIVVAGS